MREPAPCWNVDTLTKDFIDCGRTCGKVREMLLIIAAVLVVGGLVAAALFAVGIPIFLGLMAWDVTTWRAGGEAAAQTVSAEPGSPRWKAGVEGRIKLERNVARAFVILGGAFWGVAAFAGLYVYRESGIAWSLLGAFIPLVATLATLIIGWYYERVIAVLLVAASVGVVYWGVINSWEAGVWMLVTVALIGPMMTAAILFWLARREQVAMETILATRPELAPATVDSRYR